MKRILIIGCGGSGKSTLALKLGEILGIEVIHLDVHYWKPGWTMRPLEEWEPILKSLVEKEEWIMDGNFHDSLPMRIEASDTIIFLDMPRGVQLKGIFGRLIRYYKKRRPDIPKGCKEEVDWGFIKWVWSFNKKIRPGVLKILDRYRDKREIVILKNRKEVDRFVEVFEKEANK